MVRHPGAGGAGRRVAWRLVGRALRPVERLRHEVDEISHTTLHRRLDEPAPVTRCAAGPHHERDARPPGAAPDRQRRFVSDASHELRSPLATIRTSVEVAKIHPTRRLAGRQRDDVLDEVDRLDDLVGDLLQLARLDETGGRAGATADVDLDELVDRRGAAACEGSAPRWTSRRRVGGTGAG